MSKAFVVVVLLVLMLSSGAVYAGHELTDVNSVTGCIVAGNLRRVVLGDGPVQCRRGVEVHLSGGDLTGVLADDGLTGGGVEGSVMLAIDPSYQLPQECSAGDLAVATETGWECAPPSHGAFGGHIPVAGASPTSADYFDMFDGAVCDVLGRCEQVSPASMVLSGFNARGALVENGMQLTVLRNGQPTSLSCAFTAAQPSCSSASSETFAQGDLMAIEVVAIDANVSVADIRWSVAVS